MQQSNFSTQLAKFNNQWYKPGSNAALRTLWYIVNHLIFNSAFFPFSFLKRLLLRAFGAKIGKGVVIKPCVNIKYPWRLQVGNYSWIGENTWIDNLDNITIGENVCISQGVLLLCGNHNYKSESFDLITKPITLENGVWIGAKATVCPGVTCHSHSILTVGSIATHNLEAFGIYQGNPAVKIRDRIK